VFQLVDCGTDWHTVGGKKIFVQVKYKIPIVDLITAKAASCACHAHLA